MSLSPTLLLSFVLPFAAALAEPDENIHWKPLYEPGCGGAIVDVAVDPGDSKHILSTGDMLGAAVSFDGGDSWESTFGFISYEMGGITFHPTKKGEVWLGSCTGPYRSRDGGRNFESMREGMPALNGGRYTAIVEKVLFDPKKPDRLLAFGGTSRRWNEADTFGWIWESADAGAHWKHIGTISADGFSTDEKKGANIFQISLNSAGRMHLLADGAGWFSSDDSGVTWTRNSPEGLAVLPRSLTFHPTDAAVIWAATGSRLAGADESTREPGGLFKSMDGGRTFHESDEGIAKVNARSGEFMSSSFANVVQSPANPEVLYACDGAWNAGIIYKSDDGGKSWQAVAAREGIGVPQDAKTGASVFHPKTALYAGMSMTGAADPNSADRTYWFNTEYILRSKDGGATWDDSTSLLPNPANEHQWRGRGWTGWCATNFAWNPYHPAQAILQGMDDARAWISEDGLKTWRYASTEPQPWLAGVDAAFSKDGSIYISTGQFNQNNGILRSRDWGKTWTVLFGAVHNLPEAGWGKAPEYCGIHSHPDDGSKVWVVSGGQILHSEDAGETWKPMAGPANARHFAADPTKPNRFYVSAEDGIWVTEDGKTFTSIGGPAKCERGRINCDAKGRLLACAWRTENPGVWRYDPSNKSWKRLLDEPLAMECVADPSNPARLLLMTNMDPFCDLASGNGVWVSSDDGASWSAHNDGLPVLRGQAAAFDPSDPERIVVGTFGRGFFTANWPKTYKPLGTRTFTESK